MSIDLSKYVFVLLWKVVLFEYPLLRVSSTTPVNEVTQEDYESTMFSLIGKAGCSGPPTASWQTSPPASERYYSFEKPGLLAAQEGEVPSKNTQVGPPGTTCFCRQIETCSMLPSCSTAAFPFDIVGSAFFFSSDRSRFRDWLQMPMTFYLSLCVRSRVMRKPHDIAPNVADDSNLTVPVLLAEFEPIEFAMKTSFGPNGKAVLIAQKSPKEVTVTKVQLLRKCILMLGIDAI